MYNIYKLNRYDHEKFRANHQKKSQEKKPLKN